MAFILFQHLSRTGFGYAATSFTPLILVKHYIADILDEAAFREGPI